MLFNSFEFLLFLPIVFGLYWFVCNRSTPAQNALILAASFVFYGWWDYRFLGLILLSILVDYGAGIGIEQSRKASTKKAFLLLSMFFNLGLLGFFKYFNFFVESWVELFASLGYAPESTWTLNIVLPVGISFYTFQTMSYTIDVYKGNMKATRDFVAFAAFVSFFPQLVAGPIERASNLLPQMQKARIFSYQQGMDGMKLILWGLFKKVVIADALAPEVDYIFANYDQLSGGTLLLGAVYFAFQIYGDFSGYSDIAIGVAKLFGFELMSNFRFPYFSRNISEFWHRWHISLSTWFRDYLYFPLGGSRVARPVAFRNILIIFLVSGFWHGANWTFIVWGGIHALLYLPSFLVQRNTRFKGSVVAEDRRLPSGYELWRMLLTFGFVTLAWVFFRSPDVATAWEYLGRVVRFAEGPLEVTGGLVYVLPLLLLEWKLRRDERLIVFSGRKAMRYAIYLIMGFLIYSKMFTSEVQFIYFQF